MGYKLLFFSVLFRITRADPIPLWLRGTCLEELLQVPPGSECFWAQEQHREPGVVQGMDAIRPDFLWRILAYLLYTEVNEIDP